MKNLLLPSFATLLLAAPALAQSFETVVLVRCGASDIVLNEPLLDALLDARAVRQRVADELGKQIDGFQLTARMPAAHLAGTYQVHLETNVTAAAPLTADDRKQARGLVLQHVRDGLDDLFFARPRQRFEDRRRQLREQFAKLHDQLQRLQGDQQVTSQQVARRSEDLAGLEAQLLDAQMQLSTEHAVRQQLEKLRDQNVAHRENLRKEHAAREKQLAQMRAELKLMQERVATAPSQQGAKAKAQAQLDRMTDKCQKAEADLAHWRELARDIEAQLTTVFNELPQSELKLQRAQATITGLLTRFDKSSTQLDKAKAQHDERVSLELERQYVEIDLRITRQQLVEVGGQLARLTPVHVEVLGTR